MGVVQEVMMSLFVFLKVGETEGKKNFSCRCRIGNTVLDALSDTSLLVLVHFGI
jgi:hypothetical protein